MLRDYRDVMKDDPDYAQKAAMLTALCRDPVEIVEQLAIDNVGEGRRVAFQAPCSLINALKLEGRVEALLTRAGFEVLPVMEQAICCGSAGTYSLLQPTLARQLRDRKLQHLQQVEPAIIATANIGCLTHLNTASKSPVRHWLSLLESPKTKQ
jgi:glycolate oxidase iron-sulfur subunit